jgi:2-dehydropantoate 2-reductase
MRVGIIGAGSIGLLFAAYMSKVTEVTLYTKTHEQAAEINKNGIVLKIRGGQTVSIVNAQSISEWMGGEDLTIIAVKQYQLQAIMERINQLPIIPKSLLFLQNGMAHLKQLETIPLTNTFVGSVEHGALKENLYTVSHNGEGTTNVAVYKGDYAVLEEFLFLAPPEFPIDVKEDFYQMMLNKLMVNAVVNPLTAILHVKNGELIKNHHYFHVLKNLFSEISTILNLENREKHLQQIIDICHNTSDNRSSMLKDIEAHRKTEVDAILGYILEEARNNKMKAPQIENLYYLIKGKEMIKEEIF